MNPVVIEVPATSANLGPGFDSLGMALNIVDTVRAEFDERTDQVILTEVEGTDLRVNPERNLICRAYRAWGRDTHLDLPGVRFTLESRIQVARGLGSSAAAIVAGLAAAAYATGDTDPQDRMLRMATEMEGHPDNAAAALMGGVTAACRDGDEVRALHIANHLALSVVLYIPDQSLQTRAARAAIPASVSLQDAVFNIGHVAYLTTALIWGRWDQIGLGMQDRLHQSVRGKLIPSLGTVIQAAVHAGAYGAALSGGGPAVLALTPNERAEAVVRAMESAARVQDWPGHGLKTTVREEGITVREEKPDNV